MGKRPKPWVSTGSTAKVCLALVASALFLTVWHRNAISEWREAKRLDAFLAERVKRIDEPGAERMFAAMRAASSHPIQLSIPKVVPYEVCPALSDDALRDCCGSDLVNVQTNKKEDVNTRMKEKTLGEFLDTYKADDTYYTSRMPAGWLARCGPLAKAFRGLPTHWTVWMSSGGTTSVLHTDSFANVNCVLEGTKYFEVAPPEWCDVPGAARCDQHGFMGYNHEIIRVSKVDPDAPDTQAFPKYYEIPFENMTVGAGECLFLPPNWLHTVRSEADSTTQRNIAINRFVNPQWIPDWDL